GDRVLIRLPNCLEYPTVFLGAMKCGAIPVPTSTLLTAEEVLYLATDSGAVAMVTDRSSWSAMGRVLEDATPLADAFLVGDGPTTPAGRVRLHDLETALAAITRAHRALAPRADD